MKNHKGHERHQGHGEHEATIMVPLSFRVRPDLFARIEERREQLQKETGIAVTQSQVCISALEKGLAQ